MGNWILLGAGVLGLLSVAVIGWSLWANRAKPRPRVLATGAQAPLVYPPQGYPPQDFAQPSAHAPSYDFGPPASVHTVLAPAPGPLVEPPRREKKTIAMTSEELFGDRPPLEAPPPRREKQTIAMTSEELFGDRAPLAVEPTQVLAADELVEDEATQFLSSDDLFGGPAQADPGESAPYATVVLDSSDAWTAPPSSSSPRWSPAAAPVRAEPVRVEPVRVEPVRVEPQRRVPSPAELRGTIPHRPLPAASIPSLPSPSLPSPIARAKLPMPPSPSSRPASRGDLPLAPPDPAEFVKPIVNSGPTPYAGYVAPGSEDDDDDDDDDREPETEMVHQAELMRLISQRRPPG